jgi:Ca2+-binding RTX toxin-like protein
MTVSYLTRTDLGKEDGVKNLDTDVKKALLNALYADGIYTHSGDPHETAVFQDDLDLGKVDPTTQILELDTNNAAIDTSANPSLAAIIMDDAGGPHGDGNAHNLTVTGSDSIFVAMGDGADTVTLNDSGNDTVYGGGGHDFIDATNSTGHDSLVGAGGHDVLLGAGGYDTIYGGSGRDTLIGTGGNDTITGHQGDYLQETGHQGSQFWLYGSTDHNASSTLQGGSGDDTFHIETKVGNDTIYGGGGHDTVYLDAQKYTDLSGPITKDHGGGYTLSFTDGQKIHVSGISELHFSDGTTIPLK